VTENRSTHCISVLPTRVGKGDWHVMDEKRKGGSGVCVTAGGTRLLTVTFSVCCVVAVVVAVVFSLCYCFVVFIV